MTEIDKKISSDFRKGKKTTKNTPYLKVLIWLMKIQFDKGKVKKEMQAKMNNFNNKNDRESIF